MSIEKIRREYTPICDGCGETLPAEDDFYDAVEAKKRAGWRSQKYGSDWYDYCPACQQEI
ncbi:MAG: hypothetical protein FWF10_00530 [Clostridiales bacterium]|nr:hypothetical protein [Clostridiales bacterium]